MSSYSPKTIKSTGRKQESKIEFLKQASTLMDPKQDTTDNQSPIQLTEQTYPMPLSQPPGIKSPGDIQVLDGSKALELRKLEERRKQNDYSKLPKAQNIDECHNFRQLAEFGNSFNNKIQSDMA